MDCSTGKGLVGVSKTWGSYLRLLVGDPIISGLYEVALKFGNFHVGISWYAPWRAAIL